MHPDIAPRENVVRQLFPHGVWSQYATVEQCLELLDLPTFNAGMDAWQIATRGETNPILFCSLPVFAPLRGGVCKWPNPNIRWAVTGSPFSIDLDTFQEAIALGFSWWAEVCGIQPEYSSNPRTAHAVMYGKRLDGRNGVLAQSELPCGLRSNTDRQLTQEYDGEAWVIEANPPAGKLDLARVACHELGHLLGLDHISGPTALLNPTYNPGVRKPQPADIAQVVARYGQPKQPAPPPAPAPVPPPGAGTTLTITVDGRIREIECPGFRCIPTGGK